MIHITESSRMPDTYQINFGSGYLTIEKLMELQRTIGEFLENYFKNPSNK
jgi:hypothetical protein